MIFLLMLYSVKLTITCMAVLTVAVLPTMLLGEVGWLQNPISLLDVSTAIHEFLGNFRVMGDVADALMNIDQSGQMNTSVLHDAILELVAIVGLLAGYDIACGISRFVDGFTVPIRETTGWLASIFRGFLKFVETMSAVMLSNLIKRICDTYMEGHGLRVVIPICSILFLVYFFCVILFNEKQFISILIEIGKKIVNVAMIYSVVYFAGEFSSLEHVSTARYVFVVGGFVISLLILTVVGAQKFAGAFSK